MHSGSLWARLVSISSHRHQSKWYMRVIRCVTIVSREVFFFPAPVWFCLSDIWIKGLSIEKAAEILRRYQWFPREISCEERTEKFHTDDPFFIWLVEANLPHGTTNEKHDSNPGICARSSDVISRDETSDGIAKCWLFPRAVPITTLIDIPVAFLFFSFL